MKKNSSTFLSKQTCEVFFGSNLCGKVVSEISYLNPSSVIIFFDSKLKREKIIFEQKLENKIKHSFKLRKHLKKVDKNKKIVFIPITVRENAKNLENIFKIYRNLAKSGTDRKSVLVAMGGGVVGDAVGFVASTYMRGLCWVNIPTTLLSQVDSALGGKTGVNLIEAKNLVGSFYQPKKIFVDVNFLKTLDKREITSGLGEILKYSILSTKIKFPDIDPIFKNLNLMQKLIFQCAEYKLKLAIKDEFDQTGVRQVLNLGHTFGHVLESYTNYKKYRHGEAVIWGLKFAALVSYLKEILSFKEFREIMNLANKLKVPSLPKKLDAKRCYLIALKDKKSENKNIKMVLFKKRGEVLSSQSVSRNEFVRAIKILKEME